MIGQKIEEHTKKVILADLEKGDPNWDKPHARAVVHYVKEIIKNNPDLELDSVVLITSAYAHDWGYSKFYRPGESLNYTEYMKAKKEHASIGADKVYDSLTQE